MDKQIKYLLGVLLLLIIAAYFISLVSGLPQHFKEDIIAFLEERVSGEISFSSVSLWPLNRIRLNKFEFKDEQGNSFKADRLNLDYSLNFAGQEEIFEIEFIELERAEIELGENILELGQGAEAEITSSQFNESDLFNALKLPDFLTKVDLNIKDSRLSLKRSDFDFELSNLHFGLKAEERDIYTANFSASIAVDELNLQQNLNINNFNLSSLQLQFKRSGDDAELYFESGEFNLQPLLENLEENKFNYQNFAINLDDLRTLVSAAGKLNFKNSKLENYKSEVKFKELKLQTVYNFKQDEKEEIFLNSPELNLIVEGPELRMAFNQSRIFIDQNPVDLSFKLKEDRSYELKAEAEDFKLDYPILKPYIEEGDLDFSFNLSAAENEIENAAAEISAANLSGEFINLDQSNLAFTLNKDKIFLEKADFLFADGSKLDLRGSYNLAAENYLLSAEAENFKVSDNLITAADSFGLDFIGNNTSYFEKIKNERLNLIIDAAGLWGRSNELSAAGDLDLNFELAEKKNNFQIESSFWYSKDNLNLNSFKLLSDFGRLDLMGEVNLASEELQLRYAAKNLDLKILNEIFDFNSAFIKQSNPTVEYVEGSILDTFTNPSVNLRLKMRELEYQDYAFKNINLFSSYQNDNLNIKDFKAHIDQSIIKASGSVNDLSAFEEAELDLTFNSENLYFQDISKFAAQKLPLSGRVELRANLGGKLADYKLDFQLSANNTLVKFDGQELELSTLNAVVKRENGDFLIEDFSAEQQNLSLRAGGIYNLSEGFDIDFELSGFELEKYLNNFNYNTGDLSGILSLSGNISGDLEQTIFKFMISGENLNYRDFKLEIANNSLEYNLSQDKFLINDFNFKIDKGSYNLSGELFDLRGEIKSDLKLELFEVPSRDLVLKFIDLYPLADDLLLNGQIDLNSQGSDYSAELNLKGDFIEDSESSFEISGKINQALDIKFSASNLAVKFNSNQYDFNLNLESRVDFNGSIEGSINSPILRLSHQLNDLSINNTSLELIDGEILLENKRRFSASETVNFKEGGDLKIDGSYSLLEDELSLSSNLNSLPVEFLLSFIGDNIDAEGELNGNFRAEGSLESPDLSGNLDLAGDYLELGLSDPIENFSGQISLSDRKAIVESLTADYVDGQFVINGDIDFFNLENSWNLNLNGENLYFEYGSLEGLFDAELNFQGPLFRPVLNGDLETYDFIVGIPFEWPTGEGGGDSFIPKINLNIEPLENVRVKSNNLDVLVESGSLNLKFDHTLDDPLAMEGRFRSTEGVFTYYNSRFRLENAEAVFTPVDENDIPTLRANAITYAGGREININLTGPANNMRINLSSDSDLSEEEILNLLSTRGALGSAIIGGEDIGIQTIIAQELIRILNVFLQQDVISGLESDFKSALSLDRIEIDAFQYGLEREFAIYLGKNITDKFYLEYANFYSEGESDGEISFQYKLDDPTVLKGTYFGEGEYQISIETEIEF